MSRTDRMINLAIKVARLSEHSYQIGAVITKGSRVISFGINKDKSHPQQINPHTNEIARATHAELDALNNVPRGVDIKGGAIYVARLTKDGNTALAKPCKSCRTELIKHGIIKAIYTEVKEILEEKLTGDSL